MKKILLIEDDIQLGRTLKDFFECNGLSVFWAKDGETGLKLYNQHHPKLILLDVALPMMDGFEVIEEIHKTDTHTPVILMTGSEFQTKHQIKGYQLGAVNYLKKPVIPQVVLAQINNLITPASIKRYKVADTHIIIDNQSLTINNVELQLREKEAQLLTLLLDRQNTVVSREEVLLSVWGDNSHYLNNALDSYVSHLRKTLAAFPEINIESIYGCGYKLIC